MKLIKSEWIKLILKVLLTILFAGIVIQKLNIKVLIENLSNYPIINFIQAFIMAILVSIISAFSLNALYKSESVYSIFAVTLKSHFYSMVLPGQILGETTKIFLLSKDNGSIGQRVSAVLIDKVINIISMVIVGCLGIYLTDSIQDYYMKKILLFFPIILIAVFLFIKNKKVCEGIIGICRKCTNKKIREKSINFLEIWGSYANNNKGLIISALWGTLYQFAIAYTYYLLGTGLGITINFWDYCWVNTILTIVLFFPISIGGLGVREATLVSILGLMSVGKEEAVLLGLLMMCVQIIRAVLGGILILGNK